MIHERICDKIHDMIHDRIYDMTRPGVDKVKPQVWFMYSL